MSGRTAGRPTLLNLSRTRMRKRLWRAGFQGLALRKLLSEIAELQRKRPGPCGLTVMGCTPESLSDLVGKPAYKKLTTWPLRPVFGLGPGDDFLVAEFAHVASDRLPKEGTTATQTCVDAWRAFFLDSTIA